MAYAYQGAGALDYFPCRYGTSRLLFRGPRQVLDRPYVAMLGGTETYGKYVRRPYSTLIEDDMGVRTVNLGCVNAGLDVYLNEPEVTEIAAAAQAVVLQVVGAHNLSNRYYTVHPRRNDRFLGATPLLRNLFREVEFTDFHFTRHMLMTLQSVSAERFEMVAEDLRTAWLDRMRQLLHRLPTRVVLLWMSAKPPQTRGKMASDPLLIDAGMIAAIRPLVTDYVEAISSFEALSKGIDGMAFNPLDAPAAAGLPGPAVHEDVARALTPVLQRLM